jgi:SAM-dependent methyltransferase
MHTTPPAPAPVPSPSDDVPFDDNFERTLNGTGYMIRSLDELSGRFVDFAANGAPGPALDVGAAYGVATLAALARGARVVANDVEPRHLEVLASRVPTEDRDRLTLLPGAFPDDVELAQGSLGALLAARVLHMFDGPQIERSAATMFRALRPGGKAFIISEASTFFRYPQLRAKYEEQRQRGNRWPGFVTGVRQLIPEEAEHVPDQVHFLTPDVLTRVFRNAGFVVEWSDFYQRPTAHDGPWYQRRRSVGLIARKP